VIKECQTTRRKSLRQTNPQKKAHGNQIGHNFAQSIFLRMKRRRQQRMRNEQEDEKNRLKKSETEWKSDKKQVMTIEETLKKIEKEKRENRDH
jgi:hypothetical protein